MRRLFPTFGVGRLCERHPLRFQQFSQDSYSLWSDAVHFQQLRFAEFGQLFQFEITGMFQRATCRSSDAIWKIGIGLIEIFFFHAALLSGRASVSSFIYLSERSLKYFVFMAMMVMIRPMMPVTVNTRAMPLAGPVPNHEPIKPTP